MAAPQSISVKHISDAAHASVAKVLAQHQAKFPKPDYTFGFFPPHWWLGIIIRNPDIHVSLADTQKLAADLAHGVGGSAAALKGGKPGSVLADGYLTIGFAPPDIFVGP